MLVDQKDIKEYSRVVLRAVLELFEHRLDRAPKLAPPRVRYEEGCWSEERASLFIRHEPVAQAPTDE